MFSMDGVNAFSIKLLRALRAKVPRGRVISYGALAELCGNPGAARAAGMAMASNPFPLFYPCHRVVGSGGALTGFGFGLEMKRQLLTLEGVEFKDAQTIARCSFI
jgi:methylated-DNA-[protein]-cysteine S-methyltransferase